MGKNPKSNVSPTHLQLLLVYSLQGLLQQLLVKQQSYRVLSYGTPTCSGV